MLATSAVEGVTVSGSVTLSRTVRRVVDPSAVSVIRTTATFSPTTNPSSQAGSTATVT